MFQLLTVENNLGRSFAWFLYSKCRLLNMYLSFLAPNEKMQQVIKKTIEEAKALISRVSFLKWHVLCGTFLMGAM